MSGPSSERRALSAIRESHTVVIAFELRREKNVALIIALITG
jgi:hypothetical protein